MVNWTQLIRDIKPENALTGGILAAAGTLVIVLNLSVMYVLIRSGFMVHRRSGIYILAFANLIGDTIQQLVTVLYAAPSSILQVCVNGKFGTYLIV
jgi:hypothetical protein